MLIHGGGLGTAVGEEKQHLPLPFSGFHLPSVCQPQEQRGFSPCPSFYFDLDQQAFVEEEDVLQPSTPEQGVLKPLAPEQGALKPPSPEQGALKHLPKQGALKHLTPRHMREKDWWIEVGQSKELIHLLTNKGQATWDEVVVTVLNMIRCRKFIEYNPKTDLVVPTRFGQNNVAFFDLDKESGVVTRSPISKITPSNFWRAMDNPQLITSPDDMLTLADPFRALAVTDSMFFEFHLKIKRVGSVDQDLSKCLLEHNTSRHTCQPMNVLLKSCLSTVVMVHSPVSFGVEASLEVNVLNGASSFTSKITACTTESRNRVILYDNEVSGTQKNIGSVALTRCIVAVSWDEGLVLDVSYGDEYYEITLWYEHDAEQCTLTLGPYELLVKVTWTAIERCRRPKMWEHIGDNDLLL